MHFLTFLTLLPFVLYAGFTDIGADFEDYLEGAAAAAVGGCGLGLGQDAAAWGYNPATGVDAGTGLFLKHTSAFEKEARINNDLAAASYRTAFGGVGLTLFRNGAGDIHFTSLPDTTRPPGPDNRPVIDSTVTASDWVAQTSVAFEFKNLSVGSNVKLYYRDLVAAYALGLGADLGVRWRTDWGLHLGARVKNVSSSPMFWSTDSTDFLVPRGALGAMQEFRLGKQKLRLFVESEVGFMGVDSFQLHIGPAYLSPRGGAEFVIHDIIALRVGRGNYGWSVGAGGRYKGFFIDYAYRGHDGGLGGTHLVAAGYTFKNRTRNTVTQ